MRSDEDLREQLAAANALLERWLSTTTPPRSLGGSRASVVTETRAHLLNQPDAPAKCEAWQDIEGVPGRCVKCWCDECQCQPAAPTRTEAICSKCEGVGRIICRGDQPGDSPACECVDAPPAGTTRTDADREQDVFPGMPPAGWKP